MVTRSQGSRSGTVLPMMVAALLALMGFVALAIDVGLLAVARSQCQNAADIAALTGVRALNGDASTNNNFANCEPSARIAARANNLLGAPITDAQITIQAGSYTYDDANSKFTANIPKGAADPYSLVQATVSTTSTTTAFGSVFGVNAFNNVSATAQAVHRPRDLALIMDYSGSMRFGSLMGVPYWGNRDRDAGGTASGSNNPETVYPQFGHYSSASAGLLSPNTDTFILSGLTYSPANITQSNTADDNRVPVVEDFYQHNAFATPFVKAFSAPDVTLPPDSYATTPGGDVPLKVNNVSSNGYAQTVGQILNNVTTRNWVWELDGYSPAQGGAASTTAYNTSTGGSLTSTDYTATPFNGYTQGPRYWGKTFFTWPPDPRWPVGASGQALSANDTSLLQQFLQDFGYSAAEANGSDGINGARVQGIYAVTTQTGSLAWTSRTAANLASYLTTYVRRPGSTTTLLTSADAQYQRIMRLFNRPQADWRKKFFTDPNNGNNPLADNTRLFNSGGFWNRPIFSSGAAQYTPNYTAILNWITSAPNLFPAQLRAGHILYYDAIPTSITGSYPNFGNANERFWKEYIDYVLGIQQTGASTWASTSTTNNNSIGQTGYGEDFSWGTFQATTQPSATQFMNYSDNPRRPRTRMWFGPMTMVDFMGNYNRSTPNTWMWPGTCHESPMYACKIGIQAALQDMNRNHPNDLCSLIFFSSPKSSSSDNDRFNAARGPLSKSYNYMTNSLWFPQSTLNADGSANNTEIRPYDIVNDEVPRAKGGTCYPMGLMLAYNQFATTPTTDTVLRRYVTPSATVPEGVAGGMGRKGAQKIVIFETDGQPNVTATPSPSTPQTSGSGSSAFKYYKVRYNAASPGTSEYPATSTVADNSSTVTTQIYSIIDEMKAQYGTSRKPLRLYCVGFGPVFDASSADRTAALATLQTMQYRAGTQASASTPLDPSQIITGTDLEMATNLQTCIGNIMQGGLQVALIK